MRFSKLVVRIDTVFFNELGSGDHLTQRNKYSGSGVTIVAEIGIQEEREHIAPPDPR